MILEAKTSLMLQRANHGVMFTLVDDAGNKLGDVLIDWAKVPLLIDKLVDWQTESKPKHHHVVIDPAAIGVIPSL